MNYPRFEFFVTPCPCNKIQAIYKPPQDECDIILAFTQSGYTPLVSVQSAPKRNVINDLCGLVSILSEDKLIKASEYVDGQIFAIIYYQQPISSRELDIASTNFSPFFGYNVGKTILTRSQKKFIESGCLDPPPANPDLGGSDLDPMDFLCEIPTEFLPLFKVLRE